jgi:DNA-binding CsgD family transcriptional regulator
MTETSEYLKHYGILRKSGRYPWGSGETPNQRHRTFLDTVDKLRKDGLSETEIAKGYGITTTQLRATKAIAKNEQRKADASRALRLKDKGMSNVAIGEAMGINESSVRALLNPATQERNDVLAVTADMLKGQVAQKGMIDIGAGVEAQMGISGTKLNTAVAMLQEEGYTIHYVKVEQLGTGNQTTVKVLAKPETTYSEVFRNQDKIQQITDYSEDGGRSYLKIEPPASVNSKRLAVRYAEEGGTDADGVIYLRPGVDDVSLGGARYAQVRIAVDGTHYLKGMAMYKDDLPEGVDLMFNTNKSSTGNKLDALKPLKNDEDLPFGAVIKRQRHYTDASGKSKLSSINVVNEEGDWGKWSKTLSSQMLSKQSPALAKAQLDMTFARKKEQYDEIMGLTNPVVKKKLLQAFSDDVDSAAVHLKAAALPRQSTHVILPIPKMKETEIYAPNYRNGEKVVLVRFPHGGKFEIPELTVNNRQPSAKSALGNALDAVGIHPRVAERLSGADFDGDTVLVIPNSSRKVKTASPLADLKGFDPQTAYPRYDGMPLMSARTKQLKMGDVSNLITDMTIHGATDAELARAVRHSMVVIDAEKHKLNWKQSQIDNGISELKQKYQGSARAGASTLISRASSDIRIPERKPRSARDGGPIDPKTGKKVYAETGAAYVDAKGKTVRRTISSTKLAEAADAYTLSSGTKMEAVYADHSNKLKSLANTARKSTLSTTPLPYSPSAKNVYSREVDSLNAKLNVAIRNKPLERQAQIIANSVVRAKRQANPDLEPAEIKKIKAQALNEARIRTGASKQRIDITTSEWDAIQAGAISTNKLSQILDNADLDVVKKLATPRTATVATPAILARAQAMLSAGYTQAEIADQLGIPTSTLNEAISREES